MNTSDSTLPRAPRPALSANPLVSCLTVTQPGRQRSLARAIGDFYRQLYPLKELVLLHDGDIEWHQTCESLVEQARLEYGLQSSGSHQLVHVRTEARESLGALRNRAVASARGELICQWDDDDRYHPLRLVRQVEALREANASACYLEQQIHYFADSGEWMVEDWSKQPYPRNLVQGSALVRRDVMPRYPAHARGEDTALLHALVQANEPIARVHDAPWLYCYSFHGGNTFDRMHHANVARDTQLSAAAFMNIRIRLEREIALFAPPVGT